MTAAPLPAGPDQEITIVRPTVGATPLNLRELWSFRELLYYLVWRSIKVRYKQTLLGASWAVLQPLLTMLVLSVFLGQFAGVPSDGLPYPLFVYAGLVIWAGWTNALTQATQSLVEQQSLLTRVYFPRILLPLSGVIAALVDVLLSLPVLIGLMIFYGIRPASSAWTLPLFMLLATMAALGIGLWLSALNVRYRDVRYSIPFLIQLWFLATPVMYPASVVPERWQSVYGLNPLTGIVEGFRFALFGGAPPPSGQIVVSTAIIILSLFGGSWYFRRMETTFADVV
jgi:lipopolysaccharide transport system permease protein